jgi:hypothetical protein
MASGAVGGAAADTGAAGAAMEGAARAGPGGVLRAAARAGPAGLLGLHADGGPGGHDRRRAVRAPAVPLRPDVVELGARVGVLLGELCEPERGPTAGVAGQRRGAGAAPHRPADDGGAPRRQRRGVHGAVRGAAAALRGGRRGDERGVGARERRLRAGPPAAEGGPGAGAAAAGQPRLREPAGLRGIPARGGGTAQRRAVGAVAAGAAAPAGAAAAGPGDGRAAAGAGGPGQHDPGQGERLLGAVAADRRVGGGVGECRAGRGALRRRGGAADGPAAGPGPAPHRLPARGRVAGPEAGRVRAVLLSRGAVPGRRLSAGLRGVAGRQAGAVGHGVRTDPAAGRVGRRGGRRAGPGAPAGRAAVRRRGGRASAAGPGRAAFGVAGGDGAAAGPGAVRPVVRSEDLGARPRSVPGRDRAVA